MIQDPSPKRTPLETLGEFALIDRLTSMVKLTQKSTTLGVGDDAAIVNHGGKDSLLSTDMLVEGVHFDLTYMPLKHLGYKAAVVNFSDIYAMNGKPTQLLVSLAASNRFPLEALEELYEGLNLACKNYGVDLVGGDSTSSMSGLVLSLTAMGEVDKGQAVRRSGAKPNDLIVVTGDLGSAYMGLQILRREKTTYEADPNFQPDLQGHEYVLERQLKPEARQDVAALLKDLDVKPTSMIDISDGLSSELLHLCKQSGTGCAIFEDKLPIDPATIRLCEEFGLHPATAALNGGEDYELLFTVSISDWDKIKGNPNLTAIGHMSDADKGSFMINQAGDQLPISAQGWTAYTTEETQK